MMNADATTIEYQELVQEDERPRLIVRQHARRQVSPSDAGVLTYQDADADVSPLAEHRQKLVRLQTDQTLVGEAETPNDQAIIWGHIIIDELERMQFPPTRVVASAEGGIAVCFVNGQKYADIECLNSGDVIAV